ncbi:hypothetical protein O181_008560 [Austropuccinia psidii MF-1]|uniref:Uncharacterized protein n=1 Tax=Austropuccinia psidii MF-1 TaxID=1389203 RepID=A0A9Q3BPK9_9BASI|nr:hypothetical protein [Austropuccinia psidii MF-1]
MLEKARKHALRFMEESFSYAKDEWDNSHFNSEFNVGYFVLVSTTNFNNTKGCKKLEYPFARPFVFKALNGENSVEVELSEELSSKYPTLPVSLIKPHKAGNTGKFPIIYLLLRNLVLIKLPNFPKKEDLGLRKE